MDSFDVTPVELQVCGSVLAQVSGEVRTELGVLRQEMDALLGGGWQGSAANGFAQGPDSSNAPTTRSAALKCSATYRRTGRARAG